MIQTTRILLFTAGMAALASTELLAQAGPGPASTGFVNVNIGAQPMRQSFATSASLPIYGETATLTTSQGIGNGAMFDISGGYRMWRSLAVGVGFSSFSKSGDSNVTARVPHPLFFDQFKASTATATGLEHSERTIYVTATWLMPVTEKIDVAISAGPAFVKVTQAFVSSVTVPAGTQDVAVATTTSSENSAGGMIAFDGTYLFHRNVGVGLLLRYVGSSVTIPVVGELKAGGFHAGLGARIRF